MEVKDTVIKWGKIKLLLGYIDLCFSKIREDWADPRWDCNEGCEALGRLKVLLELSDNYHHKDDETDEQYYSRIRNELQDEKKKGEDG